MTTNRKYQFASGLLSVLALLSMRHYDSMQTVGATSLPGTHSARPAEKADANDLLVLRFDNSLNGESGETPTTATGTSFQTGVQNQGVLLPNPNQLFYSSANNINATEGSLEWWMKPTWNGNDALGHIILEYGGGGGIIVGKDGANNLRIILNRFGVHPGGEVGIAVNIASWTANQWHHVAFTWSNSAKQLAVYTDGTLRQQISFTANLPAINSPTLQIGGAGGGDYIQAVVDNLRISNVARTAQEISTRMLEGATVSSWTLSPATTNITLYPGWFYWTPLSINAVTNVGNLALPLLAATWTSSNPAVAVLDASGRFKALSPGAATLTGSLGGVQNSVAVNVTAPALPPVEETIEPFMATPAAGHLYRVPVVIIRYFPTLDGVNLDATETGTTTTLAALKANTVLLERRHKFMLEEGSKFRGYANAAAAPALGYQVIKTITVYEAVPPGFDAGGGAYFPDYNQILTRFGGENFVNNLGVKEFWIVQQHHGRIGINESNMSSPTTGDISNSFRTTGDQPIYNKTYVTYGINFTRSQAEATHNHGHQLESILSHVNQLRDGNTTLWWGQFARAANNPPARCGNTHFPPNALSDYDYTNLTPAISDILAWVPAGGPTTMVNANTWGNVPYAWPGGVAPSQEVESKWYIFWMQSFAGRDTAIPYNSGKLTNWWAFTGDWDAAIQGGLGLHEPGNCGYALSATSQTVPLGGGTVTVNVTAGTGCKWIASSNETWATVTGGSFGNGNGTVTFNVAATGATRTGTIAVAGQLFTITQNGGCTFTINPTSQTFPGTGGTGTVNVTTQTGCTWTATSNAAWLTVNSGAPGSGNGTVNFTVAVNPDLSRSGSITIAGQTFTVTQGGFGCSFTINPTSQSFGNNGDSGTVNVTTLTGCNWLATSNAAWLTVTSGASGNSNGTVNYTAAANAGVARTGTITIAGQTFTVTQSSGCPTITVNPANATLTAGTVGTAYSQTFSQTGGTGASNFSVSAGTLPGGLTLNSSSGVLSGTPTAANTFNFTVRATDANTCTGERAYSLTVNPAPPACPTVSGISPNNGAVGSQVTITGTNFTGVTTVRFSNNVTASFTVNSATQITTTVPAGAVTGPITISKAGCTDVNTGVFTVVQSNGLQFYPLPRPLRLVDTRAGGPCDNISTPITGGSALTTQARITCGGVTIPATAQAIVGNVMAINQDASSGFLTLFPAGQTLPTAENMRYEPNQQLANNFTVGLSANGEFRLFAERTLHAVIDVSGYFAPPGAGGLYYHPLSRPLRLLDTRPDQSLCDNVGAPITGGTALTTQARLTCDGLTIPAAAQAIVGNATVINLTASLGFLTLFPSGQPVPLGVNMIYAPGQFLENAFTVGLSAGGQFDTFGEQTIHVVIDVAGYYSPEANDVNGAGKLFHPLPRPLRLLDTRAGMGLCDNVSTPITSGTSLTTQARVTCDGITIPSVAEAVVGNVTVINQTASFGFMTLFPAGQTLPLAANMIYAPGQLLANGFVVGLGASGEFNTFGERTIHVVVDVSGYFALDNCPAITVNPATIPNGTVGTSYPATQLTATGGTAPHTFSVSAGTLPGGLLLNAATGGLSGAPTTAGTFNFTVRATDANGCFGERAYNLNIVTGGLQFYPLPRPLRLLDTRAGQGPCDNISTPITGGNTINTQARVSCGGVTIPAAAQAIVGNVTVINQSASFGFLTLFPAGQQLPLAANIIYEPGQLLSNNFAVGLNANGEFSTFAERTIHVVIDVSGYFAPPGAGGLFYHALPRPLRLLDTRPDQSLCDNVGAPISGGTALTTQARIACDGIIIPAAAQAIVGNATVINQTAQFGFLTLFPAGQTLPLAANMIYAPGQLLSNYFTVGLSAGGQFDTFGERTIHVVIDVAGYYSSEATDANGPGLLFNPLPRPVRLLDTRAGGPCDNISTPIAAGGTLTTQARVACDGITIPTGAQAVNGTVTVLNQTAAFGFLTLFPAGQTLPLAANMIYAPGQLLSNAFVAGLSGLGEFNTFGERTIHVVVDVSGYFAP